MLSPCHHHCFKNSQVVSVSCGPESQACLLSYLGGDGGEKFIGYLKPGEDDLATVVIVATEVDGLNKVIG